MKIFLEFSILEILMLVVLLIPILKISKSIKNNKSKLVPISIFIILYLFFIISYDLYSYIDFYFVTLFILISMAILSRLDRKTNLTMAIYYSSFIVGLTAFAGFAFFYYFAMIIGALLYLRNLEWRLWLTMILGFISSYAFLYFLNLIFYEYFLDMHDYNLLPIEIRYYILFAMVIICLSALIKLIIRSHKVNVIIFICCIVMVVNSSIINEFSDKTLLLYIYPLSELLPYLFSKTKKVKNILI